jgi:hypothetical protein
MTTPKPRQLAAWALVGYAGLYLVFAFFGWVLPDGGTLGHRSTSAGFTSLVEMAMPVLAVLLADAVAPRLPQAKLIATVALLEYVVILVFGVLTLLIGLGTFGDQSGPRPGFDATSYFVLGLGRLGLAAVAGLMVYGAWTRLGGTLPAVRTSAAPPK